MATNAQMISTVTWVPVIMDTHRITLLSKHGSEVVDQKTGDILRFSAQLRRLISTRRDIWFEVLTEVVMNAAIFCDKDHPEWPWPLQFEKEWGWVCFKNRSPNPLDSHESVHGIEAWTPRARARTEEKRSLRDSVFASAIFVVCHLTLVSHLVFWCPKNIEHGYTVGPDKFSLT
jgi:hypothetical protein